MIIALDVDGVVADLAPVVRFAAELTLGRSVPPTYIWKEHAFPDAMGLTEEEWDEVVKTLQRDGTFGADLPTHDDAASFVQRLQAKGHDVYFLTAHWRELPKWVNNREYWLRRHFGTADVVFTHSKARGHYDLLLDDHERNVLAAGDRGVLLTRPWNEEAEVPRRVNSFEEFLCLV